MVENPLTKVRAYSGLQKRTDETLREYVMRVGQEADIAPAVVEESVEYVVRWQYAESPPEDDAAFRAFLAQLDDSAGSVPEREDSAGTAPERAAEPAAASEAATVVEQPGFEPVPECRPLRAERRETRSDFKGGLRGREPRTLLLRFVGMLVTAPILGWMLGRAWVPGHVLYDRGAQFLAAVLGLSGVEALELVGTFGLGLYVALLVLFVIDVKKRVQGMLLALGSALALGGVAAMDVFLPNLEVTLLNLLGLVFGFAVGLVVESDQLLSLDPSASSFRRPTLQSGDIPEFRHAALLLFALVTIVIVGSVVQAVLSQVIRVYDIAAAGVFLFMSFRFIQYESETSYMILGPARAGKSMLTLGLCLEMIDAAGPHPDPNDYLQNGLERMSNLRPGDERWPIPSTPPDELEVASFEVIAGYYFPRRLELTALDYAGQHLARVAERFKRGADDDPDGSVTEDVADWIRTTDTLLVLLDIERLVHPDKFQEPGVTDAANISWGLEHYTTILTNQTQPHDEVVVVATKCDILIDQQMIDPPSTHNSYETFREAVTERLSTRPDVSELLEVTGETTIHPVYYVTKRRDGEYVPRLDEAGNLMPVGFSHLIGELRRRQ